MISTYKERKFELIAVAVTGVLKFLVADWLHLKTFYLFAAVIFWLIYIYLKHRRNHNILKRWGFQKLNFYRSFLFLMPFALAGVAGIILYGVSIRSEFLNWNIVPVMLLYPVWGIIQQFIILGLIAGNLKAITKHKFTDWQVIFIVCSLFALVHYPDVRLMLYAAVMELIFIIAYFRWKNLWSVGLYHGWVSSFFIFFVLQRDLWIELWEYFR